MEEFGINPVWAKFAFDLVQSIVLVVIAAVVFVTKRTSSNQSGLVSLEKHLLKVDDKLDVRMAATATKDALDALDRKVTAHIAGSPNREDIAKIHRRIDEIMACVKKMEGRFEGLQNVTDTLHKAHIKN